MVKASPLPPQAPDTVAHASAVIDANLQRFLAMARREREALAAGHTLASRALRLATEEAARELSLAFQMARAVVPFLPQHEVAGVARLEERRKLAATELRIELGALAAVRSDAAAARRDGPRNESLSPPPTLPHLVPRWTAPPLEPARRTVA